MKVAEVEDLRAANERAGRLPFAVAPGARWAKVHCVRAPNSCLYCGVWGSPGPSGQYVCATSTCMLCGATQCMSQGSGHGTCGVCLAGLLPGYSGNSTVCAYKGCERPAAAYGRMVNGKRRICAVHAEHQGLKVRVAFVEWWYIAVPTPMTGDHLVRVPA